MTPRFVDHGCKIAFYGRTVSLVREVDSMLSWIVSFCLLEALLVWYCTSNRPRLAWRMFLAGATLLLLVGAADAFTRIAFYQNVFESGFVGLAVLMVIVGVMTAF